MLEVGPAPVEMEVTSDLRDRGCADTPRAPKPRQVAKAGRMGHDRTCGSEIQPHVSYLLETFYRSVYLPRKQGLGRNLSAYLRLGRTRRRSPRRRIGEGRLKGRRSVHERPEGARDRSIGGHWEGDLILGKRGESALGAIVE
jgi:transposase, IS30 family